MIRECQIHDPQSVPIHLDISRTVAPFVSDQLHRKMILSLRYPPLRLTLTYCRRGFPCCLFRLITTPDVAGAATPLMEEKRDSTLCKYSFIIYLYFSVSHTQVFIGSHKQMAFKILSQYQSKHLYSSSKASSFEKRNMRREYSFYSSNYCTNQFPNLSSVSYLYNA